MALLKNLQEKYASRSTSSPIEDYGMGGAEFPELEDKNTTFKTRPNFTMRSKKRGASNGRRRGSAQDSHKTASRWQKFCRFFGSGRVAAESSFNREGCLEVEELREKNRLLAGRLENLEDRSWEIRESEEIHRSLFEAFGDIVLHHNAAGVRVFQNQVFDSYFDDRTELDYSAQTTGDQPLEQPQLATREVELETLKGRRWFSWTDLPVRDPQTGDVGIRSVARDITQQKNSQQEILSALDKAEHANEAKSRFLAMVSHEIRTPLNGIIGMAGLLSDGGLAPDQKSYVEAINSSGSTLLNLIEDLLDTARIEGGHVDLTPRPTNLNQLVEDVAELLAPAAQEKGLELATFVASQIPDTVLVDSGRLRQILLNLAGNAVKFTKSGGVGLNVTVPDDLGFEDSGLLKFTVSDSGPGLSEEDHQRIFEEFVQTDEGATRAYGGAGLGLAISKNLVELMDGQISVSSRLGRGTSFELVIQAAVVDRDTNPEIPPRRVDNNVALILSRTPARQSLVQSIKGLGAKVNTFDSPEAFYLNYNCQELQGMPQFDTVIAPLAEWDESIFQKLKATIPGSTRLINISDNTVTGSAGSSKQAGIDAWLTRPVRKQTLYRVLSNQVVNTQTQTESHSFDRLDEPSMDILLAEDNPINALLAKSLLNKMGHRVIHVVDGSQAVEAVEGHNFDLILMDLHMPVMDGLTALKSIRSMGHGKAEIPIIVLSADGQATAKDEALKLGAEDYMVKPIKPEELRSILRQYGGVENHLSATAGKP